MIECSAYQKCLRLPVPLTFFEGPHLSPLAALILVNLSNRLTELWTFTDDMAPQHYRDQSILILGAGCFGLAIAHSLASAGYSRITVVDKANSIPSPFSAANDLNKVIRAEYADAFYTGLSLVS